MNHYLNISSTIITKKYNQLKVASVGFDFIVTPRGTKIPFDNILEINGSYVGSNQTITVREDIGNKVFRTFYSATNEDNATKIIVKKF